MAEPVEWLPDGTPRSPRFDDLYRSHTGRLEQAHQVFLGGCGLPAAWAGQAHWRILETGFGLGLNFLAAWRVWKDDAQRPLMLHYASIEAWPVAAADLVRNAAPYPELHDLADALAAQWWGIGPGIHRLAFDGGRVLLTVCIGDVQAMLREQAFAADSVFLDGFDPRLNEVMWEGRTLKAVARCCRRGAGVASWTATDDVRRDLVQHGFQVEKAAGLPPNLHHARGVFDPHWEPRGQRARATRAPGCCIVIGGGLAGAACAASLARRGWQVRVFDAALQPASGASALPAGLLAPHLSSDDALLSRLTRCGVRMTLQQSSELLDEGQDWQPSGALKQRADEPVHWHETAAWIKPAALVREWLGQPGVEWCGHMKVARIELMEDGHWELADGTGAVLGQADLVVVAAAHASAPLLDGQLAMHPVRGQVTWAFHEPGLKLPGAPLNGNGHFIPSIPWRGQRAWLTGSTYAPGETSVEARPADHQANLERLGLLAPDVARQLAPQFDGGGVHAWTGVRCAATDRRPLLGELRPGLWVSTAMGSRGLTFASLCAELLSARLHGEPLPMERKLAQSLDTSRQRSSEP
ncbi:MAG: tRNA (5-methylaminomethyl-2-thiouridine)(34)-methyltransferase MnmD [Ramlibacter sp.]